MSKEFTTRALARADLRLSDIGLGTAPLGNLYRPVSDAEALGTCRAALDAGISYFDTAPYYGFGLSERRLGDALREHDSVRVSTKVGRLLEPDVTIEPHGLRDGFVSPLRFRPVFDYRHEAIYASWRASLQRLGLPSLDILYVHDIGRRTHGADHEHYFTQLTKGGGLRALEELRSTGAIKAFGLGVNEIEVCLQAMDHTDLDVILLAGRYTLLEQKALDRLLPACERRGTSVVIGGPYNSGILAAGTRHGGSLYHDYAPAPSAVVERVRRLEACCERFDVPLAAAALQFPLGHKSVVSVIPGLAGTAQLEQTRALYQTVIPAELWSTLKAEGLLREDAPVPVNGAKSSSST